MKQEKGKKEERGRVREEGKWRGWKGTIKRGGRKRKKKKEADEGWVRREKDENEKER